MGAGSGAARLLASPEGMALKPRTLARSGRSGRVSVCFDPRALSRAQGEALSRIPSAELSTLREEDGRPSELELVCPDGALAELAPGCEAAALLDASLQAASRPVGPPRIVGIVNVTPDSFSDGGLYLEPRRAIEHGERLVKEGADILDVGGESTRPGAQGVSAKEELARVLPVIEGLAASEQAPISIDTTKAVVAAAALEAGAEIVNDVSAGRLDPEMLPMVAARGARLVLMHAQGDPATMQEDPSYGDPVADVVEFLRERVNVCLKQGIDPSRIVLDPGIGFGKRLEHNVELLRRLPELRSLGMPLLLGVSRKSFIGHLTGTEKQEDWSRDRRMDIPENRLAGTAAAVAACVFGGAEFLRVHDVQTMAEVTVVAAALRCERVQRS